MINSFVLFDATFWFYLLAGLAYIGSLAFERAPLAAAGRPARTWGPGIGATATWLAAVGWAANTAALILRGVEAGHVPWANQFESMCLVAWGVIFVYLIFERVYGIRVLGAFVVPVGFLAIGAASLLPYRYRAAEPLVPALQSYWIWIHVTVTMIAYAAFAVAGGLAVAYLVKERSERRGVRGGMMERFPESDVLDELTFRAIAVGFPLLALGIILGAVWARYAWGGYWSWDPKETWSLITWFVYAAYLHARMSHGWRGKKMAVFAVVGFFVVVFCYWGVNFVLSGLHSYA